MRTLSIAARLRLMGALSAAILLAVSLFMVAGEYRTLRQGTQDGVRQAVETAVSTLAWAHAQEQQGKLTRAQAQQAALDALRGARYSGKEYFWLQDLDARMLMHPFTPELEGQDASSVKDPDGRPLFQLAAQAARQSERGGFVEYQWPRPGEKAPAPKIAYARAFAPWGWVVGSGIYVDDLRARLFTRLGQVGAAVAVALAVLTLFTSSVVRTITRGLNHAVAVAEAISRRDLTTAITVDTQDETGRLLAAMRRMADDLRGTLGTVREASMQLAQASEQIAAGNQDLSSRTENTAASLEETAASMEELTGSVASNAQSARRASDCASAAREVAGQGGEAVAQVVATMDGISASSRRIADIIGVIDGIAFQTNILALNAAVEAARAGEQGRGFAVVAGEVRSLAQRSAEAAKEIKQLIGTSVAQVEAGAGQVRHAGDTMQRLVDAVHEAHSLIQEITTATHEQSNGIAQVNTAVADLDRLTQQNAALVEESAAAAASLREQAEALAANVARFQLA